MIFLAGGPPHLDMWELKAVAPSEIRGEFKPIPTNVSGIQVCELFPRMAKMADKLVLIRSIVGAADVHVASQCLTGRSPNEPQPKGGWPYLGSVIAKVQGNVTSSIPPAIGLSSKPLHKMRRINPSVK